VKAIARWLMLVLVAVLALQVFFIGRIAVMAWITPESTSFERSEAWRLLNTKGRVPWRQHWVPYNDISDALKRAVIASEDGSFINHSGVEWDAIEAAWKKNAKAQASAQIKPSKKPAKIIGGSTITQQLAKNLLLSGERTLLRKGQEFVLTQALEVLLSKRRILELYLNHVEWGEGIFGAEAAARHYFGKSAAGLGAYESARLAVMLPRPKYFEKLPNSSYVAGRAMTIVARMQNAELP
jgi:monofunctional biosynthetic peptidoglycan transglycosylase